MLVAVKESVCTSIPRERSDQNAFWPLLKGNLKISYESSQLYSQPDIELYASIGMNYTPREDVPHAAGPLTYP